MRVDHSEWNYVAELAEDIRIILAGTMNSRFLIDDKNFQDLSSSVATQLSTLERMADEESHQTDNRKPIDKVRIKVTLTEQAEKIARLLQEAKDKAYAK